MNCDLAAELLPWLLNGTLEAGERRELIEHLRRCDACRAALADTQVAWDLFDWHPPAAALVAYAGAVDAGGSAAPAMTGDASADARSIEEHLAGCPKCAAELELVRTSRLLADPAEDGRIAILPAPRKEVARRQGMPAPAAAAAAAATAAPAPTAIRARRDDAAARRAWQRSALAASIVGLLAATGWIESAHHSRELERRLAATPARAAAPATASAAPAPAGAAAATKARPLTSPATAVPSAPSGPAEAELRRRADEAEAKLSALADKRRQLQQEIGALDRTATELKQRSEVLQASQAASGPRIERDLIESDLVVTEVEPAGRVERGAGAPAAEAIPLSSGMATLLLHTRHGGSYAEYEIEVRDAQGRLVDEPKRVFRQDSLEDFGITLRRRALTPGAYTLHLFGRPAAGGREALETYSIRVS